MVAIIDYSSVWFSGNPHALVIQFITIYKAFRDEKPQIAFKMAVAIGIKIAFNSLQRVKMAIAIGTI